MKRTISGGVWWVTFVGGALVDLLGGLDQLLQSLLFFMIADYVTGVLKAFHARNLSSEIGYRGLLKKGLILFVVMIAVEVQQLLGDAVPFREMTIMFYVANEGLSLLENIGSFIPLPVRLKNYFIKLKDDSQIEK